MDVPATPEVVHLGDDPNDPLAMRPMNRASTAPSATGAVKPKFEESKMDDDAPPGRKRANSDPRSRTRSPPGFGRMGSHSPATMAILDRSGSGRSLDVVVPPRERLQRMNLFTVPNSSLAGLQRSEDQLSARIKTLKEMGFNEKQALVGVILTDDVSVEMAIEAMLNFEELPANHDFKRKSGVDPEAHAPRHPQLNRFDVEYDRWPWNVKDEDLCATCGLPLELFHNGNYDLSAVLDEYRPRSLENLSPPASNANDAEVDPNVTVMIRGQSSDAGNLEPPLGEAKNNETPNSAAPLLGGDMVTCGICFDDLPGDKIHNAPCGHFYCVDCLRMHYKVKIMDGDVLRLPCVEPGCDREIKDEEILKFCDEEMTAKFNKFKEHRLIMLKDNARFCPKPGCKGWMIGSKWRPKCTCPVCGYQMCWKCQKDWHGFNGPLQFSRCVQHHDAAFLAFTLGHDIQSCPKCKVRVWKNGGCNHMTCRYCKYEFCWLCRGKYTHNHFEPWNIMGCPGGQDFPSCLRCPGWCPSYVNRIMIIVCLLGVIFPLALAVILSILAVWFSCWLLICIPCCFVNKEYRTPCGCKEEIFG